METIWYLVYFDGDTWAFDDYDYAHMHYSKLVDKVREDSAGRHKAMFPEPFMDATYKRPKDEYVTAGRVIVVESLIQGEWRRGEVE